MTAPRPITPRPTQPTQPRPGTPSPMDPGQRPPNRFVDIARAWGRVAVAIAELLSGRTA